MTQFFIEVVSDIICPWCYIGKQRLEKAIALYKNQHPGSSDTFSIEWIPYYINPDLPVKGIDKREHYIRRFGAEQQAQSWTRLKAIGDSVGIDFKFGGKIGNTRNAHRLSQLGRAKSGEMQTRVVNELFSAYFENEQDITDLEVLKTCGVRSGLSGEEVTEWLSSDKGGQEVDKEVRSAKVQRISGVPNYTINGLYRVSGAQDSTVFLNLFEQVKAMEHKQ